MLILANKLQPNHRYCNVGNGGSIHILARVTIGVHKYICRYIDIYICIYDAFNINR